MPDLARAVAALAEPIGEGIDGAAALLELRPGHPLHPRLSITER